MKTITLPKDLRKTLTESTPVQVAVGATDAAVSVLRTAQADLSARASKAQGKAVAGVETLRDELTPAKLRENAQNVPNLAISKTLEVAGKAEETYSELATRGKTLIGSVRRRSASKDLIAQGKSTVTLGKAAVTTVRKAGDDTLEVAKATLSAGRHEVANLVGSVTSTVTNEAETEVKAAPAAAKKATKSTRAAAKRTATTARTRTATAKKATKATSTSARKTGTAAKKATKSASRAVGTR